MQACSLSQWSVESRCEPHIRVGIVLPADGMAQLIADVPARQYELILDARSAGRIDEESVRLTVDGNEVVVHDARGTSRRAAIIRLVPVERSEPTQGSGVRLHDVVTGRGFHWQKRVTFSMEGVLEFRAVDGLLLGVNEIALEDYLQGVITAEMSGRCPVEFLKSQCVVARSWVLAHTEPKHADLPIDRCNDDCCQRYHGTSYLMPRAAEAVAGTRGQVVSDATGRIIDANYSKSCGGIIEAPEHVWFISKSCQRAAVDAPADSVSRRFMPVTQDNLDEFLTGAWLQNTDVFCSPTVVPDRDLPQYLGSVDDGGGHFRWCVENTPIEIEDLLRRKLAHVFSTEAPHSAESGDAVLVADTPPAVVACSVPAISRFRDLRVLDRGPSGRASRIQIEYADAAGNLQRIIIRSEYRIREVLHTKFLYSSAFAVEIDRDVAGWPAKIRLRGAGWGHGAGLCQIGALGMATKGYACRDILRHYFEGVDLQALY